MNESTCRHCKRRIVLDKTEGWVDLEATGDDAVWRETCDSHDTFTAEHEPAIEHDYAEHDTQEALRDHLVEQHLVTPGTARTMHEAGGHHLRTMHRMMHREDPAGD